MADLLGIGSIIKGGVDLAKLGIGLGQWRKGTKQMNKLLTNRPQYDISQGYKSAFNTYQKLANQQMPGYDQMQGQIGQSTAKTQLAAERGAMGSNQYLDALLKSQDQEMEALRNLGVMSSQWRTQQQQNLAGAQNQMGQLQDQQWDFNVNQPWQTRMNMANEQRLGGAQNTFGGLQGLASGFMDYAGTKYYQDAIQGLYPQSNGGQKDMVFGNTGAPRLPAPPVTPTNNWMNYKGQLNNG